MYYECLWGVGGIAAGGAAFAYGSYQKDDGNKMIAKGLGCALAALGAGAVLYTLYQNLDCFPMRGKVGVDVGGGQLRYYRPDATEMTLRRCTGLTDQHLDQLAQFSKLKHLVIMDGAQITKEGLDKLTKCPEIGQLTLWQGKVTEISKELADHLWRNQLKNIPVGQRYSFQTFAATKGSSSIFQRYSGIVR